MTDAERGGSDAPTSGSADGEHPLAAAGVDDDAVTDLSDVEEALSAAGFEADESVLTRRQAEVLVFRERGIRQSKIASMLGTSRANVSSIESSARQNVAKARETVAFAEALTAPVQIPVGEGTDLYDVPKQVYDACDEAGTKVNRTAPELMKTVSDAAGDAIQGREVRESLLVGVTTNGQVQVRRSTE
jgi:Tfx family DNA-binding protein